MSDASPELPALKNQADTRTLTLSNRNLPPHGFQNHMRVKQDDVNLKTPVSEDPEQKSDHLSQSVVGDPKVSVIVTVEESTREDEEERAVGGDPAGVPTLVITKVVEEVDGPPESLTRRPLSVSTESSVTSSCDGGDSSWSDSVSLTSESAACRRSDEDDTRSVTASSVTSLFHRVQLDPLEKDWMRSTAVGNMSVQRLLLTQDPSLVMKKTALHWAAKHGRQDLVDLMLQSGADVNVRSGYTPLHLAAIHDHQHIVHALIHTYNAKVRLRDYHGKTAAQYWRSPDNVFVNHPPAGTVGKTRETQRQVFQPLLMRSRSHGHLNLNFRSQPESRLELYL